VKRREVTAEPFRDCADQLARAAHRSAGIVVSK
jgi:hypothetical protein